MKLGVIGLGKMGAQIAQRLKRHGHEVVGYDPDEKARSSLAKFDVAVADSREALVQALGNDPLVWLMIPADYVTPEAEALFAVLPRGAVVIDGGNSNFRDTQQHAQAASQNGIAWIDVGTSGGVHGLEEGFSLMIGGDHKVFGRLEPIFKDLAAPNGYSYFGTAGAGHFVKMVHNAVEYGIMQSYGEGYRMLQENSSYSDLDLAAVAQVWQHGSIIESKLNGMVAEILAKNPSLEGIDGAVAETGEARWALEEAEKEGVQMPAAKSALDSRHASQDGQVNFGTKLLAALRNAFGGHKVNRG